MQKLFMLLLGAYPKGRLIEQHDMYIGIGGSVKNLVPNILQNWPEANGDIHIDAWREINYVDGYTVEVVPRQNKEIIKTDIDKQLFFLNLGGYKLNEFEEFHYKTIVVASNKMDAIKQAKATAFFKHTGFKGAAAHIDEKYGIDVDDVFQIDDILPVPFKQLYSIRLISTTDIMEDEIHVGYFKLNKF